MTSLDDARSNARHFNGKKDFVDDEDDDDDSLGSVLSDYNGIFYG